MRKMDLLESKIKILRSQVQLGNRRIEALEYHIKHGHPMSIDEYNWKPEQIYEINQRHAEQIRAIDLEIENIDLKEKLQNLEDSKNG